MATKTINALAKRGLAIKVEMEKLKNELDGINAKLVKAGEGETYQLDTGRVIVTTSTSARPSGTFELRFDKDRFLQLDPADPARQSAMNSGIVALEPGTIGGRAAVVQYSLNK